jgi:protein-tyrosine-phosphatase/predicted ATP-grasp superfamily ATP-dependent carboligase
MNILLLCANDRACYSLAKSYSNYGYHVTVLNDQHHPVAHSRFVRKFITINSSFTHQTSEAAAEIKQVLTLEGFDCLIPVNDIALTLCIHYMGDWSNHTQVLNINSPEVERFCVNKFELLQLAQCEGLPVPATTLVTQISEIDHFVSISKFPVIAKPVQSKKMIGECIYSYSVKKFSNAATLRNFLREKVPSVPVMLQEVLGEGFGVGYNFMSKDGEVIQSYAHQRLNEAWGGGQSSYRKSIPIDNFNLHQLSRKLIKKTKWSGIAMLEYRVINGIPFIMEINGRPWGSIEVGTYSGVPLAMSLVKAFVTLEKVTNVPFKEVYVRNLFNDFIWVLKSKSVAKIFRWILSLRKSFRRDHYIEDSLFEDFGYRIRYISQHFWQAITKTSRRHFNSLFPFNIPAIQPGYLKPNSRIAFVCKGNINRSAFAESYFKAKYIDKAQLVNSYGFINEQNRLPPVQAIKAASTHGIDLESHRSKCITVKLIEEYDFFIAMDSSNWHGLIKMGVPVKKVFLLNPRGIKDPYGEDQAVFDRVFLTIKANIDKLYI